MLLIKIGATDKRLGNTLPGGITIGRKSTLDICFLPSELSAAKDEVTCCTACPDFYREHRTSNEVKL